MRFVLCDDDELLRSLVETVLERQGHEVIGVADHTAIGSQLVKAGKPDAVIVDLSLGYNTDFDIIETAIDVGARVIIFDEPTSSLSQTEADRLYALIGRLRSRGVACIYVSHRMPEVFHLCDTVSVLRDGQHVATRSIGDLSERDLVQMMIGRPLADYVPRRDSVVFGDEALRVEGLSSPGKFEDVSFTLRSGEVLGLAGLVGAGRSELAQALFGLDHVRRGAITVGGKPARVQTPAAAIALGLGLVPEDRKRQALVPQESGMHNLSLAILRRLSRFRLASPPRGA